MQIKPGYIILHMCTINEDHIMYGSWDIRHNKQSFLSFWVIFCLLTLLTTWKIKDLKKWKKMSEDIIILHLHTTNDDHMTYGSWITECNRQNVLSFWTIFDPFNPLTTQKIKTLKKWKNAHRYYHFTCVT